MASHERTNVTYISDFLARQQLARREPDIVFQFQDDPFVYRELATPNTRIDTVVPTVSYSFSDDDVFVFVTDDERA